jgi:branched-chain amino acid transport system ATP-binding protein
MLKVQDVHASYGPVAALQGVTLDVDDGAIVTVLGANGAGKTSTLRLVSGIVRPSRGSVEFMGRRIDRQSPERIVGLGISHVPEGRQLFTDLTVQENLALGAYSRKDGRAVRRDIDRMHEYFPILAERRRQPAGALSGGEQQMLAIARGLMSRPRLLLLDEPSLGLAPLIVREIFRIVRVVNEEEKVTVLLVEQNASIALSIASFGYVLETGRIVLGATGAALREDEGVRKSYLGY